MSTNTKMVRPLTRKLNEALRRQDVKGAKKLVAEHPFEALSASRFVRLEYQDLVKKWAADAVEKEAEKER
ncbi:MAG: hypothetical protein JRN62_03590 [Nitrososphaerota archaeon]|jgi:hypothetical protein|nr:hypothetical protein [Nitrososphaerota archaeon]MDG6948684.1 hypothetical protein [Nitrososphaerota archaeon]